MGQWNWLFLAKLLWLCHDSRDIRIQGQWHCSRRQPWMESVACRLLCLRSWILGQWSWYFQLWSHNPDLLLITWFGCLCQQSCHSMVSRRQFWWNWLLANLCHAWICYSEATLKLGLQPRCDSWWNIIMDSRSGCLGSGLVIFKRLDMLFWSWHDPEVPRTSINRQVLRWMVSRIRFCMGLVACELTLIVHLGFGALTFIILELSLRPNSPHV